MKINLKPNKGITLIALVITIIVLLILAGIAIASLNGQNGVLNRASDAKLSNICGSFREQTRLAQLSAKTTITSNMSSKSGYIATRSDNLRNLATEVANGLGLTLSGNNTNDGEIKTEGYTVAYYADVQGNENTDGKGYIVIWYTDNGLRSSIKAREEVIEKQHLKAVEEDNDSRNQATLVTVIKVTNYDCELSETVGLTSTTDGGNDIVQDSFEGNPGTTLKDKFDFTTLSDSGAGAGSGAGGSSEYTLGQIVTIGTGDNKEEFFVIGEDSTTITLITKYVVDTSNDYKQSHGSDNGVPYGNYGDGYDNSDIKTYVDNYVGKLAKRTGVTAIEGRLLKESDFNTLGISITVNDPERYRGTDTSSASLSGDEYYYIWSTEEEYWVEYDGLWHYSELVPSVMFLPNDKPRYIILNGIESEPCGLRPVIVINKTDI